MLTVDLDIQDRLINGQTGNISHIKFAQGSVWKVYIKLFDEQAGLKDRKSYSRDSNNESISISIH